MKTVIRFTQPFTDGTIFENTQKAGSELRVTPNILERIKSSGGEFEVLGRVIPPSNRKKKAKEPIKAQPTEQVIDDE